MRAGALVAMLMMGCGASPEPATTPTNNVSAQPELGCKAAVEHAAAAVKLREHDVTMAIGECDQHEWPRAARECVGAAKTNDALASCATTYSLGTTGIFAKTMSFDVAMKAMERFRDEMCTCKDTACAERVSDEMAKWSQDFAKDAADPPKMTDEETRRATKVGEDMGKCMQTAMSAGSPSP